MGGDHDLHGIRKRVLQAEDSHLNEPGVLDAVAEDIQAKLKEDGGWAQESHHVEKSILVLMYQCRGRGIRPPPTLRLK